MDYISNSLKMLSVNNVYDVNKLEKEFIKINIKKTPKEKKKYIIKKHVRDFLNIYNNTVIGIIPYYCSTNNINNFNKKYYINNTYLLTFSNNNIITIKTKNKSDNDTKEIYKNHIENTINTFLLNNFNITNLKKNCYSKILEIENSKIIIYSVYISHYHNINKEFNYIKFIDLYNINNLFTKSEYEKNLLKKRKFKKKIYNNVLNNKFNMYHLNKLLKIEIDNINFIELKINTIYKNMFL